MGKPTISHIFCIGNNPEPVGYAGSNKMSHTDLMKNVLLMTIEKFGGSLKGFIHHTDSDSRYCSARYIRLLEKAGATISM